MNSTSFFTQDPLSLFKLLKLTVLIESELEKYISKMLQHSRRKVAIRRMQAGAMLSHVTIEVQLTFLRVQNAITMYKEYEHKRRSKVKEF